MRMPLILVLICLFPAFCNGKACDTDGWFGTNCKYKCHCTDDNQCNRATGDCAGGCAKGWFGPQCQYVDLTTTHSKASTHPWLYDGDDSTCNSDTSTQTVTVQLNDSMPFTWLRLHVKNPENVGTFSVTFRDIAGGSSVACNNVRTASADAETLDIHCDVNVKVQEVILTGGDVKSLCSVYISGGRNVALKQSARQSTTFESNVAANAVDGNTNGNLKGGSCTHTVHPDSESLWWMTFPRPQMINRYILFNRRDAESGRLQNFILRSLNGENGEVLKYQDKQANPQSEYIVMSATKTHPIENVTIQATIPQVSTPVLTLCEVEAFGDTICEDGKYGRECEHNCGKCNGTRCFVSTGGCPYGCANKFFGYRCDEQCSKNCKSDVCDHRTKHCTEGCKNGYTGSTCEQACEKNCKNGVCTQDGTCHMGCIDGYTGSQCRNICPQPTYGPGCTQTCSINCTDQKCNHIYGKCDLCKPGTMGDFCDQECLHPNYGQNCSKICSKKCVDQVCNKVNGTCYRCPPGWVGDQCGKVCPNKTYGDRCKETCSVYCANQVCDPVNGTCDQCVPGKLGIRCDQDCPDKSYGLDCKMTCSINCTGQLCDTVTGNCHECPPGKEGDKCERECETGKYGARCHQNCSYGCGRKEFTDTPHCDVANGTCLFGCFDGFTGPTCIAAAMKDEASSTGAIVGAVIAVIVIIAVLIVVVALLLWRRRMDKKGDTSSLLPWRCLRTSGTDNASHENGHSSPHENIDLAATTVPMVAAVPSGSVESSASPPASQSGKTAAKPKESKDSKSETNDETGVYCNEVNTKPKIIATAIATKDLDTFIQTHSKEFFQKQFGEIPENKKATIHIGLSADNKKKNRYKNIIAYDHSRVKLQVHEGKNQGDYINASNIEGYKKEEMFIASQGATKVTVEDFVKMLWEQGVEKVVMLANLIEEGKQKCERYWPEEGDKNPGEMQMGEIKVVLGTVEEFANYTIRRLKLEKSGEEKRLVTQYHFTSWPDKGVPTTPWGLVDFEQRVASQLTKKPVVVHCSAGIGRTGTFIALRNVMRQAEDTGYVDFFNTVKNLRHDRINMVQTAKQYEFLHKTTHLALMCAGTTVTSSNIEERMEKLAATSTSGMSNMEREFNTICEACAEDESNEKAEEETKKKAEEETQKRKSKGRGAYENTEETMRKLKDRCQDVPAKELYKVTLTSESYEMGEYINAVFVPSFRKPDHQILTQLPLPTTVNDFWRMVTQYKMSLVVAFETHLKTTDSTIGDYLPTSEDQPLVLPMFQVTTGSVTVDGACEVQTIKVLADAAKKKKKQSTHFNSEHSVVHVKCDIRGLNPESLLAVAQKLRSLRLGRGDGSIVYMCRNGATHSGLLCVLTLLLDRMDQDLRLTVPLVVGAIKSIRPQVIPTLEQYKLLYQVLQEYSETNNAYSNLGDTMKHENSAQKVSNAEPDEAKDEKTIVYANTC